VKEIRDEIEKRVKEIVQEIRKEGMINEESRINRLRVLILQLELNQKQSFRDEREKLLKERTEEALSEQ
jgi:ketopantoate reductase